MLYRTVPKNGDELSILGFGCMRLPLAGPGTIDRDRAGEQIRSSIDRGVNYFDTAWPYHGGESEVILGEALRGGYRDRVRVATKLPSWLIHSRADMDRYLDRQLEKLDTGRIDYYLLHTLNGKSWDRLRQLDVGGFLEAAVADGRIDNAGFSFHGLLEDFKRIVDDYPWIFCQIQYNYLDRQNQAGLEGLRYAAARRLAVIVMEPLRGGNLGLPEPPPAIAALWQSAAVRRSPAEWALRWVWNHPEVTVLLSGMNDDDHIAENLAIAATAEPGSLSDEELELVDRVAAAYATSMKVACTGCGYCLPCPEGVMIPTVFEVFNQMHLFDSSTEAAKFSYLARTSGLLADAEPGFASNCVQCGECLDKCPQQIDIPEALAEAAGELEDATMDERLAHIERIFQEKKR